MKIVREDYNETVKNISAFCFFTHDDIDNLEYLSKCENRDRMLELFGYIEFNYDQFHKHDLKNKSLEKDAICIFRESDDISWIPKNAYEIVNLDGFTLIQNKISFLNK